MVANPPGPPTVVPNLQWPEGIAGAQLAAADEVGAAPGDANSGADGDVVYVEWSSEGVEYGEKLEEK